MDVKTEFLQGDLEDEIYMEQPDGLVDKEQPDYACKLNKSIYGVRHAASCWNAATDTFLLSNGYKNCSADPFVYTKLVKQKDGKIDFVIIALYVDIILCSNTNMLKKRETRIGQKIYKSKILENYIMSLVCW